MTSTGELHPTAVVFTTDGTTIAAAATASADTLTLNGDLGADVVVSGVATPVVATDAANKAYVDAAIVDPTRDYLMAALLADQSGLSNAEDIIWTTIEASSGISLNTGTGVVTLNTDKFYKLDVNIAGGASPGSASLDVAFVQGTTNAKLLAKGGDMFLRGLTYVSATVPCPVKSLVFPTFGLSGADLTIKVRCTASTGLINLYSSYCLLTITEL